MQPRLTLPDETACSVAKTIAGRFVFAVIVSQEGLLEERISHFLITLLIRLQLLSELDGPSLWHSCVLNRFCWPSLKTQVAEGELEQEM